MIRLLLTLALIAAPTPLWAQVRALRLEGVGEPVDVPLALHRGFPAFPATVLRRIGADVRTGPEGARVALFGDTLVFETHSPFFFVAGKAQQLVAPAYAEGGIVYLPHQFFAEWLPTRYADRLRFGDGVLRVVSGAQHAASGTDAAAPGGSDARPDDGRDSEHVGSTAPADAASAERTPQADAPQPRVVIIDAGHGGRDPGKPGPNGVLEKDVALAVAKRLAEELRSRGGYEVHLTRTTDTLIALADRPRMANEWKAGRPAALFLSIHANSVSARSVRGFETFFLSEARTEDERRVAEMENAAVAYEETTAATGGDDLDWILNTLRNNFYLRASNDLAEVIQRRIDAFHPGPNRGVKQAGFRVLVGAFMPAVLVEMGFISNRREEALLRSSSFQAKMTRALADAVDEFFRSHEHLWAAGEGV
ncbi:MAG TPA: N-acetylmuramoyl-L-alanine amidase [Longimicrobiales bacterium]